ncbi:hypothetical protein [Cedecea colo]|nr:hypothetical protein [Cedecea colo]
MDILTKNDIVDAFVLARYGELKPPDAFGGEGKAVRGGAERKPVE